MKSTLSALTEVPEALRSEYEAVDGKFVLKIEGDHPAFVTATSHAELKTRLNEFRQNNIGLNTAVTQLTDKLKLFGDITPESIAEMKTKLKGFEDQGAKTPDDIKARIDAALSPVLNELKTVREQAQQSARETKVERRRASLVQAASKFGVREEAIPDFLYRGTSIFNEDGVPIVDGREVMSKVDPTRPMTFEEFASGLKTEAPHLFKPSGGGGAQPGAGAAQKQVVSSDPADFGRHLDAIAKGDAVVASR